MGFEPREALCAALPAGAAPTDDAAQRRPHEHVAEKVSTDHNALRADEYCPGSGPANGHLQLSIFRKDGAGSPASHLSIPGQIAAKGSSRSPEDLRFEGSRLDTFFTDAFGSSTTAGCRAEVANR